ncbi:hypothetical protein QTO34_015017 [Cnephaeus nilssonii]|uniref:Gag protein n=1 Tax=Cnephaeus nilssonii TaxID=3371016 RepID=A0AA40I409_CNENI|nr:hypothetical protein QTO34_015017 [Eptesicus nilssonii]
MSPPLIHSGIEYRPHHSDPSPDSSGVPMLPLRQVTSVAEGGRPFMVYVPFTTSDLYNWKNQNPSFPQNPQGLISLLDPLGMTVSNSSRLFTSEERERVRAEGRKLVLRPDGQSVSDPAWLEAVFLLSRPLWDPNSDQGKEALNWYCQTLLRGVRAAARKPTNLSKVTEMVQGPNESPAAFLERLCEAYRLYTPIDPEAPENRRAGNIAFMSQSAPDIRKKLQKLEGFEGKMLSELVEVAQKTFNNREDAGELAKKMAQVLLTMNREKETGGKETGKEEEHGPGISALGDRGWGRTSVPAGKEKAPGRMKAPSALRGARPGEPRVTLQVGGKPVDFLIDIRATFSVLQQAEGPVSKERTPIQGATGRQNHIHGLRPE